MSKNLNLLLQGPSSFSPSKILSLNHELNSINDSPAIELSCYEFYSIDIAQDFSDHVKLLELLKSKEPTNLPNFFIGPRSGTISPWASKTSEIITNVGIQGVLRIEKYLGYFVNNNISATDLNLSCLFDRMTQEVFFSEETIAEVDSEPKRKPLVNIDISKAAKDSLVKANQDLGLALSEEEINYLNHFYSSVSRNPTDAELMMFAQANSEHCRHKIFNASWIVDSVSQEESLFDLIKRTSKGKKSDLISAYKDNAAVIAGSEVKTLNRNLKNMYSFSTEKINSTLKVETHNHPTAISPFPGAATGSGGEIRDEGATGRGAKPKAGLCGFSVSYLRIPNEVEKWEGQEDRPSRIAKPLEIMINGPVGAASFNNEFGRPNILGYFRSFEHRNTNSYFGFHKPIMLAGGLGNIKPIHTNKAKVSSSAKIVILGGPGYLIGLGGGSASSVESGQSSEDLDFASVQRSNPEMQRRCQEVIDQCWQLDLNNPIAFIHDVGAGGLSNAIPELAKDCDLGAVIDLNKIPIVDKSMSSLEIWCNESQERYVLAIEKDDLEKFKTICNREKCPYSIVGSFTKQKKLKLIDKNLIENSIDLDMDFIFGAKEQLKRTLKDTPKNKLEEVNFDLDLKKSILDVLRHPTVGSKNFLITIGDRNVGGLTYRDQMVGPFQVPVADNGITMSHFDSIEGEAMSLGERSPIAVFDAPASGRVAITEALTNILSSGVEEISKVKLSANWMASPNNDSNNQDLYETVQSISKDLCNKWNLTIPVGKDSLSMETAWSNKKNTSPQSLIVSAFSSISDVTKSITPDLKQNSDLIVLRVNLGSNNYRLGASILSETIKKDLGEVPDMDSIEEFPKIFNFVAKLIKERKVFSYHDISDGGLIACLVEMIISGDCGFHLKTKLSKRDLRNFLFSEELGFVMQVSKETFKEIEAFMKALKKIDKLIILGSTDKTNGLTISSREFEETIDLKTLITNWTHVSTKVKTLRDNPISALEESKYFIEREKNKLNQKTLFKSSNFKNSFSIKPKIAVLRDQGINGQVEMSAAFSKAGFKVYDVHMTDLKNNFFNLDDFKGLAFPGGFSYGDVLGAGRGWANSILMNSELRDNFEYFFNRPDTFTLGVCNGCQVLSELKEIIPGSEGWPCMKRNISNQFEARLVQLKVNNSKSIFFHNMEDSQLVVPVAHGEGRMEFSDSSHLEKLFSNNQIPLQYVDSKGDIATSYPSNPNGTTDGISSVCSSDGKVTILMPHPERAFLNRQLSWTNNEDQGFSPWFEMFINARKFVN